MLPHTAFKLSAEVIQHCFYNSSKFDEPAYIALRGKSNAAINALLFKNPAYQTEQGLKVPILRIKNISESSTKALVGLMLEALGDLKYSTRTEFTMIIRLKALMKKTGTRMIVLDGFQEFIDKAPSKTIYKVADILNSLIDDTKIVLVIAGLSGPRSNIFQNEQLIHRFLNFHNYVTELQINS